MARYVIERALPGAGDLFEQELHDISARSNRALEGLDDVSWVESVRATISPATGR
jgi:hypothetical protein